MKLRELLSVRAINDIDGEFLGYASREIVLYLDELRQEEVAYAQLHSEQRADLQKQLDVADERNDELTESLNMAKAVLEDSLAEPGPRPHPWDEYVPF